MAHAILTTKYSHAIAFYIETCENTQFQPLYEPSLFRILKGIKPCQWKSLSGLDDITASGINGFDKLKSVAVSFNNQDISEMLEIGRWYLKTRFQLNCKMESQIITHSIAHALSDPKNRSLKSTSYLSNEVCHDCLNLFQGLHKIKGLALQQNASSDIMYDINIAVRDIILYFKHLMCDAKQKKTKSFSFDQLDSETCFWLKDFSQKIFPMKFREGQREYFGKKGMSLHVDVFFLKKNNHLLKRLYLSSINQCDQGLIDILSLGKAVLKQLKVDEPQIQKLFAKSDNASC